MNEIKMPQMGQSVEEASIVSWLKKEGDVVEKGDPIFTIQTDKAEIECEATESGTLRKILVAEDIEVPVFTVVALVGSPDEALPDLSQYATSAASAAATPTPVVAPEPAATPVATSTPAATTKGNGAASPRARHTAHAEHIDLALLSGTGPGGRVIEEDVRAHASALGEVRSTPTARRVAREQGVDLTQVQGSGPRGRITKEDVQAAASQPRAAAAPKGGTTPLTPMRRVIAERLTASKFSAPHFYVTVEIDMLNAVAFRKGVTEDRPSFNDLVMYATAQALLEFPMVNARWKGDSIEQVPEINLGFAVALEAGLIVPVVRNVENLSLRGLRQATLAQAEKARINKLTPDDYSGSTFTVSNLGVFGVDHFTAIINQPDSAILAVGQIKDQVVAIDGGIHIRPMMKLTLSSDHRVIDGALAAQFMGRLKEILEAAAF